MILSNSMACKEKNVAPPELATIIKSHLADYQSKYKLHPDHYKVIKDIMECRTAFLGGHIHQCTECDYEQPVYNSCRNRHCPKCQSLPKARWLEARKAELLPVPYFHMVFTLPHEINPVALCNKRIIYGLLFKATSQTLLTFGANPKNGLGGKLGAITILHTWDQKLNDHIHLHCVVPGGVLTDDGARFIQSKENYLFPVKALSKVFRGKFMALLTEAYEKGELKFPGKTELTGTPNGFKTLVNKMWSKPWVVYSKRPFAGPEAVLGYLARYTHRIAIANHRIVSCKNGEVTFTFKNRKKKTIETETIKATEFIRRFLMHVVPINFMRIRHYGIFANRCKKRNINKCRELLGLKGDLPEQEKQSVEALMKTLTGKDISLCPVCKKGRMKETKPILRYSGPSAEDIINTVLVKGST